MTEPAPLPRRLIQQIAANSQGLVVMTRIAAKLLTSVYGVPDRRVSVIPHGVPEVSFEREDTAKTRLGLGGKRVICTFGLIKTRVVGLGSSVAAGSIVVYAIPVLLAEHVAGRVRKRQYLFI